ncbi:MAG: hypothetical protein H6981_04265 [Gammaproteobacteria bacterium]|nr:hypothetical protein [Gammaproteobacteria bacterium]MCP5135994.1 hypothetical protein [Gammaproteobacteria bacterium]
MEERHFPGGGNTKRPSIELLDRLIAAPLTQLFVCGRSGSMVLHALLDGHPEILQVPHTFKFYDFLSSHPDFEAMSGANLANAFVDYPGHAALFDSLKSVLLNGRVGISRDVHVLIDKTSFRDVMAELLPTEGNDARRILVSVVLAYSWCIGVDPDSARHIFVHVHHGAWLWPQAVEGPCDFPGIELSQGLGWLRPERLIITARNPVAQIRSLEEFVRKAVESPAEWDGWEETYMRLLVQDWLRVELAQKSGIDVAVVKLENLQADMSGQLDHLCEWMGVAPQSLHLKTPTVFGLPWWGDTYSTPSLKLNPPKAIAAPSYRNTKHFFVYLGAGEVIIREGYPAMKLFDWVLRYIGVPLLALLYLCWKDDAVRDWRLRWSRLRFVFRVRKRHRKVLASFRASPS